MKQKEKNQAYLSIWCHEVKSSHMKSESFCLCKLANAGSHAYEVLPCNICCLSHDLLAARK